jgi:response regulator RpfG family c-di-GMP phosphodiesterase
MVCSKLAVMLNLPLYLDNIGTILSAVLGGYLPGIVTAIINNMINYALDEVSIYYAGISALIAITAIYCKRIGWLDSIWGIIRCILLLAVIGGIGGGLITWFLSGASTEGAFGSYVAWLMDNLGHNLFVAHMVSSFLLDIVDKTITVSAALLILKLIPERLKPLFWFSGWKQTPISEEERKLEDRALSDGHTLNFRIAVMLIFASLSMAIVVTGVSSSLFRDYSKSQHMEQASGVARIVAGEIDPERVDFYLENGGSSPDYAVTEKSLYTIRDSSPDIEYVYVYKIMEDGCHVVFDLDTEELEGEEPGTVIPFDESFSPYIEDLLKGKPIDPIETNDTYGWLLTAYEPVYDKNGKCVCYAAADVAFRDILHYERNFIVRVVLLFLGFFILILVTGLWLAKYYMILPINSMASCASEFAYNEDIDDDDKADASVRRILDLKISTGDEVQNLYESFCKMTTDAVDHMKSIREQNRTISRMQTGLIMVMADMVEGRDSDTGNHIRKTAAYTRILLEKLREMGYYTDTITDNFIEDVEQSAPLHDVGKIAVSDVILNKPGKLTDEEFDIMKTHAQEGKRLIEQAISTVEGESYLSEAKNMAGYHHEKWNGKGYPEGISGEDIPLSARVMAIADVFDALTSKRVYKDAMPFDKAVSIIEGDSGTHFDPKCVEAFLASLDEFRAVMNKYKEDDERVLREAREKAEGGEQPAKRAKRDAW